MFGIKIEIGLIYDGHMEEDSSGTGLIDVCMTVKMLYISCHVGWCRVMSLDGVEA